jgi:hypothetical protein
MLPTATQSIRVRSRAKPEAKAADRGDLVTEGWSFIGPVAAEA